MNNDGTSWNMIMCTINGENICSELCSLWCVSATLRPLTATLIYFICRNQREEASSQRWQNREPELQRGTLKGAWTTADVITGVNMFYWASVAFHRFTGNHRLSLSYLQQFKQPFAYLWKFTFKTLFHLALPFKTHFTDDRCKLTAAWGILDHHIKYHKPCWSGSLCPLTSQSETANSMRELWSHIYD